MQDNEIVAHLIDIKSNLASQDVKLEKLEIAVLGNGQPGIAQKVEALQSSQSWTKGVGAGVAFLLGVLETILHLWKHR